MHKIAIDADALAYGRNLRDGRERVFDSLDLQRTAHIIVDLQNGFVEPGAPVEVPAAREIIGNVNAISRAVRAGGGMNVFLQMTMTPESRQSWSNWAYLNTKATGSGMGQSFAPGAHFWELWPKLDVAAQDLKIITGTLTNCCCESTARDAMQMNYKLVFVSDANAALTDAAHNGTLSNMAMLFAEVIDTQATVDLIASSRRLAAE